MKKKLFYIILILLVIFIGYKFVKFVEGIETPDLEYNTVYSEKYDEDLFNDDLLGKTKMQVIDKLGKPLRTENVNPYLKFLYRDKKDSIYLNCSKGVDLTHYNLTNSNYSYLTIEFNNQNKVQDVSNVKNSEIVNSDNLIGISKDDVVKKFGEPIQMAQITFDGTILSFSDLKEGPYTGKQPKIHMRNIVFDKNNKAVKIIKSDGYNVLKDLCEIINN